MNHRTPCHNYNNEKKILLNKQKNNDNNTFKILVIFLSLSLYDVMLINWKVHNLF